MKIFNKVAIIGVGEIGSSIGKDLRRRRLAKEVIGIGRRRSSLLKAKKVRAVDKATLSLKRGAKDADLIIIATPVSKIVGLGKKASLFAKKGALMTDVGSTKSDIVEGLEGALPKYVKFVGSHPMAGSEKGGPLNAKDNLFEGRHCFITRTKNTDKRALGMIKKFWESLGARSTEMSLGQHDRIVAKVSQMVHIAASGLVVANKDVLRYAASGFRDTTRIALSDPELWKDICVTNSKEIAKSLDSFIEILREFRKAISQRQASKIQKMLEEARRVRQGLS